MTEKRFTFVQDSLVKADVFDEETGDFVCCTLSVWVEQLVDLLNGQHEKIQQLEKDNSKLGYEKRQHTYWKKEWRENTKEIAQLKREIVQLKEEIDDVE